jgi:diguanylate cyclase (GGDEF)-like protein
MYLRILNNKMNIDYLTGLYNRMQADQYVSAKIEKCTPARTFSGVMIDVDKFKEINDKCGHHAGDEALETTANLLRKCVGKKDFIARQGGDEFIMILDTDDINAVNQITDNINRVFESYNRISRRPYEIRLSMGYDVYDYSLAMTRQQFIRHIDRLMYRKKRTHRAAEENVVGGFSTR